MNNDEAILDELKEIRQQLMGRGSELADVAEELLAKAIEIKRQNFAIYEHLINIAEMIKDEPSR